MSKRIAIVHGSFGNSRENWFPWLADELRGLGHSVIVPDFPTPQGQSLKNWLEVFDESVATLTKDTILVGHSLGAAFILRVLERSRQPIGATFLVSAFLGSLGLPKFDEVNADFVNAPVDWERVTANAGTVRVFAGDNDPYVPTEKGAFIANQFGVSLTVVKGGGHINASAGFSAFPQLLREMSSCCLS
jgi:predicted alpha/beta hydrolase family esterase